jgi:hypothetical protein
MELGEFLEHEHHPNRIGNFDIKNTIIIPILHQSISGGRLIKVTNPFCGEEGANYFEVVGG